MLEAGWLRPTHPLRAEAWVTEGVAEGGEALVEDLLAVRDEQESGPVELLAQAGVVERGHHRLARAGGGDEQVAVEPPLSGHPDQLEQSFLEREGTQLDGAQDHLRAGVGPTGPTLLVLELVGVVEEVVTACPVALEHGPELGDQVRIASG